MVVASARVESFPHAVLWDMDGTLVDTEPYWMRSETELVESFGGIWTHDDGLAVIGFGLWNSARALQARGVELGEDEIVHRLTERVREQLTESGVPWRAGARELLRELRDASIPTALVTMSVTGMAQQVVDAIPFEAFDVLITGDRVSEPKPHPEAYLRAAAELGVEPGLCVAIEDSLTGLASAVASGAVTVGVPHILPLPANGEHVLWDTLEGKRIVDLSELRMARR